MKIGPQKISQAITHHIRVGISLYRIRDAGIIIPVSLIQYKIIHQCPILLRHGTVILREYSHSSVVDHAAGHLLDRHTQHLSPVSLFRVRCGEHCGQHKKPYTESCHTYRKQSPPELPRSFSKAYCQKKKC